MKKIELEIVALSHSITQTHSYAVVLGGGIGAHATQPSFNTRPDEEFHECI